MKPWEAAGLRGRRFEYAAVGLLAVVLIVIPSETVAEDVSSPPQGAEIFHQHCAKCHGDRGEGISALATIAGPSLQAEHQAGRVMTAVEVGPSHMPQFEYVLSVDQMHAVSEFVSSNLAIIPLQPGDLAHGGELFRTYCAPCHRTAVRGGALAFAGSNAPSLTGKSASLIAGAIRWGPGPMPKFPSFVLDDQQLASVVKYIRYVQRPPSPGGSPLNWYGPVAEGFAAWVGLLALVFVVGWIEKGGNG